MADMYYSETALSLLKADLGYYDSNIPPVVELDLVNLLEVAYRRLARAGIELNVGNLNDDQLQEMYAAWIYRKRRDGSDKPQMLKQEMRDRQVDDALSDDEGASA